MSSLTSVILGVLGVPYQDPQTTRQTNMDNALNQVTEIYRQGIAQDQHNNDILLARMDQATKAQQQQQAALERRTDLSEKVKDVYSDVGSIAERDSNTIAAFLTDYNNNMENEHAHELGVDAPHATSLAPDLVSSHEERWTIDTPSAAEEERQFAHDDQQINADDTITS